MMILSKRRSMSIHSNPHNIASDELGQKSLQLLKLRKASCDAIA